MFLCSRSERAFTSSFALRADSCEAHRYSDSRHLVDLRGTVERFLSFLTDHAHRVDTLPRYDGRGDPMRRVSRTNAFVLSTRVDGGTGTRADEADGETARVADGQTDRRQCGVAGQASEACSKPENSAFDSGSKSEVAAAVEESMHSLGGYVCDREENDRKNCVLALRIQRPEERHINVEPEPEVLSAVTSHFIENVSCFAMTVRYTVEYEPSAVTTATAKKTTEKIAFSRYAIRNLTKFIVAPSRCQKCARISDFVSLRTPTVITLTVRRMVRTSWMKLGLRQWRSRDAGDRDGATRKPTTKL